jgi:hypothetical protein
MLRLLSLSLDESKLAALMKASYLVLLLAFCFAVGTQARAASEDEALSAGNQMNLIPLTNVLPPQFVRIAPYGSPKITSDYCNEVLAATKNRVLRFKNMPVKVYITPHPEPGFTEACIRGFDEWENRTNGMIAFLRVDSPEQARVRVVWKML